MKMMVFYDQEESHKSSCREMLLCFPPPVGKQGEDWLHYAINSDESFVPVTEMTLHSDLATCLMEIKAGLPLKVEVWT